MVPSPASTPSTGPFLSGCEATYSTPSPSLEDAQSAWFLKPDTWRIVRMSTIPNRPMNTGMIEEYLSAMQSWLEEWSRSGCNTFMHRQLYTSRIPTPIGDAFTTLVAYFHRTPATEQMVFRIIEDRILELVETQGWQAGQHEPLDVMGHLSRVQAMIAYLIIGLFHGNIRLRHVADTNLPLLVSWCQQMLEAAALAASNGQLLHSEMCNALVLISSETATVPLPPQAELQATWGRLGVAEKETALWHAWVVAESVRRAWLTARSVECIYLLLRDRAGICPGGLVFTMRRSVWAADSAFAWAKACAEADVEFLHIWETDRLCVRPNSDAIDEFAKVMIKLNFRTDRASQWVGGGCGG
ncbi:hypothetical protein NKR23_g4914 [Pleurostoma richardsiae]|uniref:Uncharacterized protein n=1 Tax=Pleurostoma richardsiae TaxID=41990 RepID=A0AA38VFE6_9PEZI|nr:hypothetical protein NKR23_g4914 [Pleurostoma richardsiae]